ncbi:unnamed protein product [Owenia fusiformis]|uniref:Sphingomyelin phosphodiesterase 4 n=1 Tax=Owenia fusiformis TaxID=6347 RepID=A0A8S4Q4A0_OWEFU|nr:unnamed protein product [Owenia fusiformis]
MAAGSTNLTANGRYQAALTKPVAQRCRELERLINDASNKELHCIFPSLIENIFGFNNLPGWGINKLNRYHGDFTPIQQFLHPRGVLMTLVYKLYQEDAYRYEFPVNILPYPSRQMIQDGGIPMLYVNKLQFQPHGAPCSHLTLNAFEFFMFHFAYFLVNPQHQKVGINNDGLHPVIVLEYLDYFLPMDGKHLPPMPVFASPVRSPIVHQSPISLHQHHSHTPRKSPQSYNRGSPSNTPRVVGLLKTANTSLQKSMSQQNASIVDTSDRETWRSETMVQIFVEFWLNQNSLEIEKNAIMQQHTHNFVPSIDHVKIVRMFVKQLHYFASSAPSNVPTSPYQQHTETPFEEFKKNIISQYVEKKMYAFLRHGFDRWPLDSSFRNMLETWLSYIQPWRYADRFIDGTVNLPTSRTDSEQKEKNVDPIWLPFIVENLLFFTTLYQEFISRAFRMDLTSPRNAYMLFRVAKVFNQGNLRDMMEDAEMLMFEPAMSSPGSSRHMTSADIGASYIAPSTSNMATNLQLHFMELEGPGFLYKPFFTEDMRKSTQQLLNVIAQARTTLSTIEKTTDSGGILSWLGLGPMVEYNQGTNGDDYTAIDGKKTEAHLDSAQVMLCNIFRMEPPANIQSTLSQADDSLIEKLDTVPDYINTDSGPQLTQLGRYQLMNGLRRFPVDYQGDLDLQPVRTYENATLVRLLYKLTSFINSRFSDEIHNLYQRDDFVGRVAFQYISPPRQRPTNHDLTISPPIRREQYEYNQRPRVSLRSLANYRNLIFLIIVYCVFYIWRGTGPFGYTLFIVGVVFVYSLFKALVYSRNKLKQC